MKRSICALFFTFSIFLSRVNTAELPVRITTFNLENYHLTPSPTRPLKPPEARKQVLQTIATLRPDVLAVQEIGSPDDLADIQSALQTSGWTFPHLETVAGPDTNSLLGILSRFPFQSRTPHTNVAFILDGRRHRVSRGFSEVAIALPGNRRLGLINAHLKSKRPTADGDETELREQEARLLRARIDALLKLSPERFLVVCGDFNDSPDSRALRTLVGRGTKRLIDPRPSERRIDALDHKSPVPPERPITWTHYFARDETYSRLDYILLSPGLAPALGRGDAFVLASEDWGKASDHRPVTVRLLFP